MRPVYLHMFFLHYILPCLTILLSKIVDLIERSFQKKVLFILHVMICLFFSPLMQLVIIIYGLVRKGVKLSPFS